MIVGFTSIVLIYFLAFAVVHIALTGLAFADVLRTRRRQTGSALRLATRSKLAPAISIIVPAYNESMGIADSVRSLLALEYPKLEVVVVNDGSSDDTIERLIAEFDLREVTQPLPPYLEHAEVRATYVPEGRLDLLVIDKANAGKADALNAGINYSRHELVCAIDADSILEKDALIKAAMPFIDDPARTMATGGMIRIANGCRVSRGRITALGMPRNWLAMFQTVEYLRTFSGARGGWSAVNGLLIVSGAFGLFRKDAVIAADGYRTDIVGEDIELVVRLHRTLRKRRVPYRIVFVADPVCWTEAPETLRVLRRQRRRWQRGSIEALVLHWPMFGRPRYGVAGAVALPALVLFELIGPFLEIGGYVASTIGFLSGSIVGDTYLLFLAIAVLYGMLLSLGALMIELEGLGRRLTTRQFARVLTFSLIENVGYRQFSLIWRLEGVWQFFRKGEWGAMERRGFTQ